MNKVIGGAILALLGLFALSRKASGSNQKDWFDEKPKGDITDKPLPDERGPNPNTSVQRVCIAPPCDTPVPGSSTTPSPIPTATANNAPKAGEIKSNPTADPRRASIVKTLERTGISRESLDSLTKKVMSMNEGEISTLEAFIAAASGGYALQPQQAQAFVALNTKYGMFPPTLVNQLKVLR